jgi:hypothetical protein
VSFISADIWLRRLIEILGAFGAGGRYHNLDKLLDPTLRGDGPVQSFRALEMDLLKQMPGGLNLLADPVQARDAYLLVQSQLIEAMQRFARALCRMFTLGPLGSQGRSLSGLVGTFLYLQDDDLAVVVPR